MTAEAVLPGIRHELTTQTLVVPFLENWPVKESPQPPLTEIRLNPNNPPTILYLASDSTITFIPKQGEMIFLSIDADDPDKLKQSYFMSRHGETEEAEGRIEPRVEKSLEVKKGTIFILLPHPRPFMEAVAIRNIDDEGEPMKLLKVPRGATEINGTPISPKLWEKIEYLYREDPQIPKFDIIDQINSLSSSSRRQLQAL